MSKCVKWIAQIAQKMFKNFFCAIGIHLTNFDVTSALHTVLCFLHIIYSLFVLFIFHFTSYSSPKWTVLITLTVFTWNVSKTWTRISRLGRFFILSALFSAFRWQGASGCLISGIWIIHSIHITYFLSYFKFSVSNRHEKWNADMLDSMGNSNKNSNFFQNVIYFAYSLASPHFIFQFKIPTWFHANLRPIQISMMGMAPRRTKIN